MYARRWGDNDRRFGPFLFARDRSFKHLALLISSGDDEYPGCSLRFSCYGVTMIVSLPQIIKPYQEKVTAQYWDAATIERMGRNWYYQVDECKYGFSYHDGFLQFKLGRQTHDSTTDRSKGYFLPWTQWRFTRRSFYNTDGAHFWSEYEDRAKLGSSNWEASRTAKEECPSHTFAFLDFDGERLTARTVIEEMEWKLGTGRFKWLSLFRRKKVRRSLDIEFSGETGKRKGSWKGGTMGHSIELKPGELHEAAFRRYCAENGMTFVGAVPNAQAEATV